MSYYPYKTERPLRSCGISSYLPSLQIPAERLFMNPDCDH